MFSDVPITCTAEVSSEAASLEELLLHASAARKDPAVHVSLSSYSLFKQPGTEAVPAPGGAGSRRSSTHPRTVGCWFTVPVRSFTGAQSRRKRTARRTRYIGFAPKACQQQMPN